MTDEAGRCAYLGKFLTEHDFTRHGESEYVGGSVHTDTVEEFYSVFKRGIKSVYQHCGDRHSHRYVTKFDFQ